MAAALVQNSTFCSTGWASVSNAGRIGATEDVKRQGLEMKRIVCTVGKLENHRIQPERSLRNGFVSVLGIWKYMD
jgi:hypothetical protein